MYDIDELLRGHDALEARGDILNAQAAKVQRNLAKAIPEAQRVADVAHNAPKILDDLDREFEQKTKLNSLDITFMFLAAAIQCVRWYVLSNRNFNILTDRENANLAKSYVKSFTPKNWHDILLASVPYDATIRDMPMREAGISTGLAGFNHRYRTLGHDPIMGWIFGTANILSDSLTTSDFISYSTAKAGPQKWVITTPISTPQVFTSAWEQVQADKMNLPAAIARQAIHFGSDYFTAQGLPVPLIMTVDNNLAGQLIGQGINLRSGFNVLGNAVLAEMVNQIVSCIHRLFYDPAKYSSPRVYDVKTRKIIRYSNVIASTSNVIYTAISGDLKRLDVGGILVTLWRLLRDRKFKQEVKREFITESFNDLIRGEEYDFE